MSQEEYQVCDACGVTGQMGFVIGEGDEVAEVKIFAEDKASAVAEFQRYLDLAMQVNDKVVHDLEESAEVSLNPLTVKLQFECSAEKLIFELRSRSL